MVVLDCLEDPDETLKRKTLDLLFRMTNPVNAEVVVAKMLSFLSASRDKYLKLDLVLKILQLAERYAPDNIWYVKTLISVFEIGGENVPADVPHNLLRLLAEGSDAAGDDESAEEDDRQMRFDSCETFANILQQNKTSNSKGLPDVLLKVMFWTLGEYAYLLGYERLPEIVDGLCRVVDRIEPLDPIIRGYGVTALLKICAQTGQMTENVEDVLEKYRFSLSSDLAQRCYEFIEVMKNPALRKEILPVDASCEDLSDVDLSALLDAYVNKARQNGAADYAVPQSMLFEDEDEDSKRRSSNADHGPALRYDAYEAPVIPDAATLAGASDLRRGSYDEKASNLAFASESVYPGSQPNIAAASGLEFSGLQLKGVKNVWGKEGYSGTIGGVMGSSNSIIEQQQMQIQQQLQQQQHGQQSQSLPMTSGAALNNVLSSSGAKKSQVAELTPNYDMYDEDNGAGESTSNEKSESSSLPFSGLPTREKVLSLKQTEREKLANKLFSGLAADGLVSGPPPPKPAKPNARPLFEEAESPSTKPKVVATSSSTPPPQATTQAAKPSPSSQVVDDLLGLAFGDPSPAPVVTQPAKVPTPTPSTAASSGFSTDLLDLLSGDVAPVPPPAPIVPKTLVFPVAGFTTQIFGSQWGQHTAEMKISIRKPFASIADFAQAMSKQVGVSTVEIIQATQEVIFAGTTTQSPGVPLGIPQNLVLIHGKRRATGDGVDLMIRSKSPSDTSNIASNLPNYI